MRKNVTGFQPPADTRMQHHEIDLTAYIGQPFRIRFRMDSGGSDYGSYGLDGNGAERPAGSTTCSTRMIGSCP